MELKDTNSICSKCGNENIGTKYCPGVESTAHVKGCDAAGEHLHRTCSKCGYTWIENTLDVNQPKVVGKGVCDARQFTD